MAKNGFFRAPKVWAIGLLVLILALGIVMAGCDNGSTGGSTGGDNGGTTGGDNGGTTGGDSDGITLPATTGSFTLTGADAYNGKYAIVLLRPDFSSDNINNFRFGTKAVTVKGIFTGVQIVNGTVTLPLYRLVDGQSVQAYSGTESWKWVETIILGSETIDMNSWWYNPEPAVVKHVINFHNVLFQDGRASRAVSAANEITDH
jgi:hypothetical protein